MTPVTSQRYAVQQASASLEFVRYQSDLLLWIGECVAVPLPVLSAGIEFLAWSISEERVQPW